VEQWLAEAVMLRCGGQRKALASRWSEVVIAVLAILVFCSPSVEKVNSLLLQKRNPVGLEHAWIRRLSFPFLWRAPHQCGSNLCGSHEATFMKDEGYDGAVDQEMTGLSATRRRSKSRFLDTSTLPRLVDSSSHPVRDSTSDRALSEPTLPKGLEFSLSKFDGRSVNTSSWKFLDLVEWVKLNFECEEADTSNYSAEKSGTSLCAWLQNEIQFEIAQAQREISSSPSKSGAVLKGTSQITLLFQFLAHYDSYEGITAILPWITNAALLGHCNLPPNQRNWTSLARVTNGWYEAGFSLLWDSGRRQPPLPRFPSRAVTRHFQLEKKLKPLTVNAEDAGPVGDVETPRNTSLVSHQCISIPPLWQHYCSRWIASFQNVATDHPDWVGRSLYQILQPSTFVLRLVSRTLADTPTPDSAVAVFIDQLEATVIPPESGEALGTLREPVRFSADVVENLLRATRGPVRAGNSTRPGRASPRRGRWPLAERLFGNWAYSSLNHSALALWTRSSSKDIERILIALFKVAAVEHRDAEVVTIVGQMIRDSSSSASTALQSVLSRPTVWGAALQACSRSSNVTSAETLLGWMRDRGVCANTRHCVSYLQALSWAGRDQQALDFIDFMTQHVTSAYDLTLQPGSSPWDGLVTEPPDILCLNAALQACAGKGNYPEARSLLERIKSGHYGASVNLNHQSYHQVLAACSDPAEAKEIVREMRLTRRHRQGVVPPNVFTLTKAITVCQKAMDVDSALHFLRLAKSDGTVADLYMYSAIIWTAARVVDPDVAVAVLNEMKGDGCTPNLVVYNGVLTALAVAGRARQVAETHEDLLGQGLLGNYVTYQQIALVSGTVVDVKERIRFLEQAWHGVETDRQVLEPLVEPLILGYVSLGIDDKARSVYETMPESTRLTWARAALRRLSMATPTRYQDAIAITNTVAASLGPDLILDGAVLAHSMIACSKANQWQESLSLMQRFGTSNNTSLVAMNALIAACGRGQCPEQALKVFYDIESYGLRPDLRTYRSTLIALNQAQHRSSIRKQESASMLSLELVPEEAQFEWWEYSLSLLRQMREQGLKADKQTFSSAISACEAAGQWQRALGVLQSMIDVENDERFSENSVLNLYCFNAALSALEKGGAWVEALEVYEQMKDIGGPIQPNVVTLNTLVVALDKAGQKEIAQSYYEEGIQQRIIQLWRFTLDHRGRRIRALDLHRCSASLARAAIRSHLERLLRRGSSQTYATLANPETLGGQDLVIIVGKGIHSTSGDPVLSQAVQRLLELEYGLPLEIPSDNSGRIIVKGEMIRQFVSARR
jgi:pentatricopeptide repeat protein